MSESTFPTFVAFYRQIHHRDPFPWQTALAERVAASYWPGTVSVPTGLGKTTTLHIAVWNLARQVAAGGERTAPLRMLHVVDRAVIVDQTHRDITTLARVLHQAAGEQDGTPVARVAGVLAGRFGTPLVTGRMHGAHYDEEWLTAHQPAVVTMTAHQATSRALFRGFSVSQSMSPVHAALVGMDSLILVDEPHLSAASVHTLRAVKQHQLRCAPVGVPPGQVVQLGASLPSSDDDVVGLTATERHDSAVAAQRLAAPKTLTTSTVKATDPAVGAELVRLARAELDQHPDRTVAVVVNTVHAARQVHTALTSGTGGVDGLLVTSRIRGRERRRINAALAEGGWRLVVATQTVEAGVDFSVDTLVTEVCGWHALTQRVGRLNRYGTGHGIARVVTTSRPRPGTAAVYGDTAAHLAGLLAELGEQVDVSPDGLAAITAAHPETVRAATGTQPDSPTLVDELLPTLAHTRPRPAADVDIQPFITGIRDTPATPDVTVLWRAHVNPRVLDGMPPTPDETVTVPVSAVNDLLRNWIDDSRTAPAPTLSDTGESAPAGTARWAVPHGASPPALVATTSGDWTPITSSTQITPGATVVLHSHIGGHDHTGFTPEATDPVPDLSPARHVETGRWWLCSVPTLDNLYRQGYIAELPTGDPIGRLVDADIDERAELAAALLPGDLGDLECGSVEGTVGIWVRTARAPEEHQHVTLAEHAAHVAATASRITSTLDMPPALARRIIWAAYRHDDGKEALAFQATLGAAPGEPPLAKHHPHRPGVGSAVPPGWRHEALSAHQLVDEHADALVIHLVAAHHGWARPLLPPSTGDGQNLPTADRSHALHQQYGPWGVAWLETLVRLADHEASAAPEAGHTPPSTPPPPQPASPDTDTQVDTPLAGLPVDSHMTWWAVAGALAAATDFDPQATVRFGNTPSGPVAVLTSTADRHTVADQVVVIRQQVACWVAHQPRLGAKNEKLPTEWARAAVAALDGQDHRAVLAAFVDDTQPAQQSGTPVRAPWHPSNSTLIGTALAAAHPTGTIADALNDDEPAQHDRGHHFGMMPSELHSAVLTGIGHDGRSVLHPLVLAAAARLPSTGGPRPAGTSREQRRHLPIPHTPVTWTGLVALLQTLPAQPDRPWQHAGIEHLEHVDVAANEGRTKAWTAV